MRWHGYFEGRAHKKSRCGFPQRLTNVVEAQRLVLVPTWPMHVTVRQLFGFGSANFQHLAGVYDNAHPRARKK